MTFRVGGKRWPPGSCGLVLSACLLAFSPAPAGESTQEKTEVPGLSVQIVFADGKNVEGLLEKLSESELSLRGSPQPIALWEIHELRIGAKTSGKAVDFSTGPFVAFRTGERVLGRITEIGKGGNNSFATLSLGAKLPPVSGNLTAIAAFRLREKYADDPIFEETLEAGPPEQDVFILRRSGLLSAVGVFRGLDKDYLQVEVAGKRSRVRRQLVHGVILAPIASSRKEADPPTHLEIPGVGRLPVYLRGLEPAKEGPLLLFRLPYSPPGKIQKIPLSAISRILPASDKIVFLSSIEPARVEETAVLGKAFPYRKNLSVSGAPLQLRGRTYRRGLGVHSRTLLEYALNAGYKTFAAVLGIDDSSRGKGSVTFVVSADGKELLRENFDSKREPLPISFPVTGVKRLALLVDYGSDQLDLGDHADWLNARLTR